MAKRRRHRRFHRNPPAFGNIVGNLGQNFKRAAVGAGGIIVSGMATNAIATAANITDPKIKSLVGVAVAMIGLPLAGNLSKVPMIADAAPAASSVALLNAIKQYIPTFPGLTGVGNEFYLPENNQVPRAILTGDGAREDSVPAPLN